MSEKRSFKRAKVGEEIVLFVSEKKFEGRVENLSVNGALLVFDANGTSFLRNVDEGLPAEFVIKSQLSALRNKGKVKRVYEEDGKIKLAFEIE